MKTHRFTSLWFSGLLASTLVPAAFAQKSPKESSRLSLGLHASITAGSSYTLHVQSADGADTPPDVPGTGGGLTTAVQSAADVFPVTPGKLYTLSITASSWHTADVQFNLPPGYTIFQGPHGSPMLPHTTFLTPDQGGGSSTYAIDFYLQPNDGANRLVPGYARAPHVGDVSWAVSAGVLSNGSSAGTLRWDSGAVVLGLLDASALNYVKPVDDEAGLITYPDGAVKLITTLQTEIYVHRNPGSNAGYAIQVYPAGTGYTDPGGDGTQDFSFTGGSLLMQYEISDPDTTFAGRVQIKKTDQASGLIETWVLAQSGTAPNVTTTVTQTSSLRVITEVSVSGPNSGQRTETATVADAGGTVATKKIRIYQTYSWGEELLSETADPDGLALTTSYDYYNTTPVDGHYSKLKSVKKADGSWILYDYYDDFARWGELAATYQPWQDGPTDPSAATTSNCKYTAYSYNGERSIYQELAGGSQTSINGTTAAKITISSSIATSSDYSQPLRTDTIQAFSSASTSQATTSVVFDSTADLTYNGRLYSSVNPDGTKTSASYQTIGDPTAAIALTHSGSFGSFSLTPNPSASPGFFCETYLFGTASQGDPSATQATTDGMSGGKNVSSIWMTPFRSYRRQVVHDPAGNPIFDITQVWTGSAYQPISWQECTYTQDNLIASCLKSDGELTTYSYKAGKISSQTNPDGTVVNGTFDALMRVTAAAKTAAPGVSGYHSQSEVDTNYTYDASGRILSVTTLPAGASLSLTANSVFNKAGLVISQTDTTGLTSTVAYGNGGRTITSTLADGGTQIVDSRIDGTRKSVTGTGVVAQFYSCSVNTDGTITCQTNLGTATSSRVATTTTDWLGRTISQTGPGFGGGTVTSQAFYNGSGQLTKATQTGVAPTLYQYDGLGDLQYTGLDVNNNGTLDLGGSDRIAESRTQVFSDGTNWWVQNLAYVFNQAGSATPLLQSESRQKLVPYNYSGGNYAGGEVLNETDTYDLFRNLTVQKAVTDRGNKVVTQTTTLPDSMTPQVLVTYNGLLVSQTSAQNITTTYSYDGLGRPTGAHDPRKGDSSIAYFTSGTGAIGQVSSSTDEAGNTTSFTYDSATALLGSQTDALGGTVYHGYDRFGREIKTWGTATYPVAVAYDGLGQKIAQRTFRDSSTNFGTSSWPLSDDGGDPLAPNPTSWTTGDVTNWAYDAATGLPTSKTDPLLHAVSYSYNGNNQMTTRTWSRGTVTTYSYDTATGEQTGISYSDGTPALTYTYNRLGQTATVADTAGTRTFAYSATTTELQSESLPAYLGNRILTRKYDTFTSGAIGRATGFSLGTSGDLTSDEDITYGYDSQGRLNGVSAGGGPAMTYGFVANSNLISGMTDSGSTWVQSRTWLPNRDLLDTIETKTGTTSVARFQYVSDALGRRTSKVSSGSLFSRYEAGGLTDHFSYDARSELTDDEAYETTSTSDSSTPVLGRHFAYTFDQIGNRLTSSVDGTTTNYTSNAANEYTQRTVPGNYTLTGVNPSSATLTINGTAVTSAEKQGDYYDHNVSASNTAGPLWTEFTVGSSATISSTITRGSFLPQTPEIYSYDADGNLLKDGRWHYDWDAENRLIAMETIGNRSGDATAIWTSGVGRQKISFAYDYLGRRIDKILFSWNGSAWAPVASSGETRFVYDGWNLIGDYDSTGGTFGTRLRSYVWGLDLSWSLQSGGGVGGLLATISASGVVNMVAYDGNGNVMGLTDRSTGIINAAYEYSPWGEALRSTGLYAQQNPFRFSTKYADDETGMLYYGFRYYDPKLGRFMGRDPIEEKGGLNLFAFVNNNPINSWDVLGQDNEIPETFTGAPNPSWVPVDNWYNVYSDPADPSVIWDGPGYHILNDTRTAEDMWAQAVADGESDDGGGSPMSWEEANDPVNDGGIWGTNPVDPLQQEADQILQQQQAQQDATVTVGPITVLGYEDSGDGGDTTIDTPPPPTSADTQPATDGDGLNAGDPGGGQDGIDESGSADFQSDAAPTPDTLAAPDDPSSSANESDSPAESIEGTGNATAATGQYQQESAGTCFIASIRYAESQLGVDQGNIPSEDALLQIASDVTGRKVSDIQQNGIQRDEMTPTLLSGLLAGSGLSASVQKIYTTSDPYTANLQQQQLAGYLAPNQAVIGSFYVGMTAGSNGITVQTHAQVMTNQEGQINLWNPEPGTSQSIGTTQNAYQKLVQGFQNNSNRSVGPSTYVVVIHK